MKIIVSFFSFFLAMSMNAQDLPQVTDTDGGIAFADYPMQIEASKDDLVILEPPMAITDCELEDIGITFTIEDATFSGGKYGTIERTWIASDACGDVARAIQFIVLTD